MYVQRPNHGPKATASGGADGEATLSGRPDAVMADGFGASSGSSPAAPTPWAIAHQALRGRYRSVLLAALVCAACGAAAGWWKGGKAMYRSEGLIRFPSAREDIVARAQSYDVFMQSQVVRLTSRGMVDLALQQPAWEATKRGSSAFVVKSFAENLAAEVKPRTEYIRVTYTDEDAQLATAAVRSVITAYAKMFNEERAGEGRSGTLVTERNTAAAEVKRLDAEAQKFVDEFHTTNLDVVCDEVQQRIAKLKGTLTDIRVALAVAEQRTPAPLPAPAPSNGQLPWPQGEATPPSELSVATPDRIAMVDGVMRNYVDEEHRCEDRLSELKDRFGDAHPDVARAKQAVERAKARVQQYAEDFRRYHAEAGDNPFVRPGQPHTATMVARPKDELLRDQRAISELLEQAQDEAKHDGEARYKLQGILSELRTRREELDEKNKRLTAVESAAAQSDGMEILSYGETPLVPLIDSRKKLAGMGGVAGGAMPVGLVIAVWLLRRTYRFSDDATSGPTKETPLLGILPEIHATSTEAPAAAAQNVHQMRVMLQVMAGQEPARQAYLVSSACPGEGKTSVTTALGVSFAAAGARTVVVDGDLVGQSLTRSFRAQQCTGLREAIAGRTLRGHLRKTLLVPQLYMLSAGNNAGPMDASMVSPEGVRWLMGLLGKYFDVVLIDSGPILGSVEASLFAPQVDGVLFVISRGQQHEAVQRASTRLSSLGASVRGFIFNRARHRDFIRSVQVSSYRREDEPAALECQALSVATTRRLSVGPLADAVLASVRA